MNQRPLETGLRLTATAIPLLLLAMQFGNVIVSLALPLVSQEIEALVPQFRIVNVALGQAGADKVIYVEAAPSAVVVVADRLLPIAAQSRFNVSTLAGHVLQPVIVFLAIVISWPARNFGQRVLRLVIGAPLLITVAVLDVPIVLAAELHSMLLDVVAPDAFSLLVAWKDILEGGGRVALAILAAAATVSTAAAVTENNP
jgi:hypothetical protein